MTTQYRGTWKPERIATLEQLAELAKNRKSVAFFRPHPHVGTKVVVCDVRPAAVLMNRTAANLMFMFQFVKMHEYIKPTPPPRLTATRRYTRKKGKREGIRRILQEMLDFDNDWSELSCCLLNVLEGLDPDLADRIRDDDKTMYPDLEKAKAELKELEEA